MIDTDTSLKSFMSAMSMSMMDVICETRLVRFRKSSLNLTRSKTNIFVSIEVLQQFQLPQSAFRQDGLVEDLRDLLDGNFSARFGVLGGASRSRLSTDRPKPHYLIEFSPDEAVRALTQLPDESVPRGQRGRQSDFGRHLRGRGR
jgi:hypothetical protein